METTYRNNKRISAKKILKDNFTYHSYDVKTIVRTYREGSM